MDRRRERRLPRFAYLLLLVLFPPMLCVAQSTSGEVGAAAAVLQTTKLLRAHTIPDDWPVDDETDDISPKLLRLQTRLRALSAIGEVIESLWRQYARDE